MKDKWKVKRLCPNTLMDMGFIFSLVCGMGSSVSCIISCFFIYYDSDTSEDDFFFFFSDIKPYDQAFIHFNKLDFILF